MVQKNGLKILQSSLWLIFTSYLSLNALNAAAQNGVYEPETICGDLRSRNYPEYHECFTHLENTAIINSQNRVQRNGNNLCLHPPTGDKICLSNQETNNQNDQLIERYYYFGTPENLEDVATVRYQSSNMLTDDVGIYLFISLKNGKLLAHTPATAQQLAFSPDGQFLAAYNSDISQYVPHLKIWNIDHSPNPQEWDVTLQLLSPFALGDSSDFYDAQLSWLNEKTLNIYSPSQHSRATFYYRCGNESSFYAQQVQITSHKIHFAQPENCSTGSWGIHLETTRKTY